MTYYIRNDQYESVKLGQDWSILNTDNYSIITLNEIGGYCWKLLEQKKNLNELVSEICNEYDVNKVTAEQDISTFLKELEEHGIIQYAE